MNEPANRNMPLDLSLLERRISMLEDSLTRVITFDQTIKTGLTHALDRIKNFETLGAWAKRTDHLVETARTVESLGHASMIYPKNRSVLFVAKGYFGDNIKYSFLSFLNYAKSRDVTVQLLADDDKQYAELTSYGLPCLSPTPEKWTIEDMRTLLGMKVIVLDDNFHPYSRPNAKAYAMLRGAKTVQLWHGIPMKDIGLRYILRCDKVILEDLVASCGPFDVLAATSASSKNEWEQIFAFNRYAPTGYPRNDVFFRDIETRDLLNVDLETYALLEMSQKGRKPTILYAPTFRDDQASNWFSKAGIAELAEHARQRGYVFAINLHPFEQRLVEEFRKRFPGIHFTAPGTDVYPCLKHADILITDYSSIAFDFLLMDRPLVYYRPNHAEHVKHSRGFIEGKVELTPGTVTEDPAELIRAIDTAVGYVQGTVPDIHRTARQSLRTKLFDNVDGKASERIGAEIMKLIDA